MKKLKLGSGLFLPILALLCLTTQARAVSIELELLSNNIVVGDSFGVLVKANDVPDNPVYMTIPGIGQIYVGDNGVVNFGFNVASDAGIVFDSAVVNSAYFRDSSFLFPGMDVAGDVGISPAVSGDDILLATLTFSAGNAGAFSLGITSDFTDPNQGLGLLPGDVVDMTSSIDISVADVPPSSVPAPSVAFLFGIGPAGLLASRRRSRAN